MPDGTAFDPLRTALIEQASVLKAGDSDPTASARLSYLSAGAMEVQIQSKSPAFLVTSDPYYPGWQATVDGLPVPVHRANYAIRGVFVPAGDHTVRFQFKPRSFYLGVAGSVVSLLGLILIAVPHFRRVKH
jgi:uncharacterized membrane protein YfhO